jgi:hypothetical protein
MEQPWNLSPEPAYLAPPCRKRTDEFDTGAGIIRRGAGDKPGPPGAAELLETFPMAGEFLLISLECCGVEVESNPHSAVT